jgi:hypothetical protein
VAGPNICLTFAILAFYYGVMNGFFGFYSGLEGGMTTTGDFTTVDSSYFFKFYWLLILK